MSISTTGLSNGTQLTICEIEIYECSIGTYGVNCSEMCHCVSGACDRDTGECDRPCRLGWKGPICSKECEQGTEYGHDCEQLCSDRNCLKANESCNVETGDCPNGCESGWKLADCLSNCPSGTYGSSCLLCAGRHCDGSSSCHELTGACDSECENGWSGVDCAEGICPRGKFGESCYYSCNCGQSCTSTTGDCTEPCDPNWEKGGDVCQINTLLNRCSNGTFGPNCTKFCHCMSGFCAKNGTCTGKCNPGWKGASCSQGLCENGTFGEDCSYSCNCGVLCNSMSGDCFQHCDSEWLMGGKRCQKRDLTIGAILTSNNEEGASSNKIVDGDFLSCFTGKHMRVELPQHCILYDIRIYMQDVIHMAGTTVYLNDNSTDVCYTFPEFVYSNPIDIVCEGNATSLNIENVHNVIHICEIKIIVCSQGTYGTSCLNFCHCKSGPCHRITGKCRGDCKPGWHLDSCSEECHNAYGSQCYKFCINRYCAAADSSCDTITGACDTGCQHGWTNIDCATPCGTRTYGTNCGLSCDDRHCLDEVSCNPIHGKCNGACLAGWNGLDCMEECQGQYYGINCHYECSERNCELASRTCDSITGVCTSNCKPGWTGLDCRQECSNGTYGINCTEMCRGIHCVDQQRCHHLTGVCVSGCTTGWYGDICNTECNVGYYGLGCYKLCNLRKCHKKDSCNKENGYCEFGCKRGFFGDDCTKVDKKIKPIYVVPSLYKLLIGFSSGTIIFVLGLVTYKCVLIRRRRRISKSHVSASEESNTASEQSKKGHGEEH